jgi:multicomponent Na+:H+ antiporter subunit B
MIARIFVIAAIILFGIMLFPLLDNFSELEDPEGVAAYYLDNAAHETGTANIVTSVVVSYRGFDTLGEVAVLFLAAAGVGIVLKNEKDREKARLQEASEIVKTGAGFLFPLLLVFGVYIFVHGHLTPGGGFQGGVVIASAISLLFIAGLSSGAKDRLLRFVESVSGLVYLSIAVAGIILAGGFLDNRIFSLGKVGTLLSAGAIPVIYIFIGLKVGTELTGIVRKLKGGGK